MTAWTKERDSGWRRSRRGMEMTPRESILARAAERPQKRGNYRQRKGRLLRWKRKRSEVVLYFLTSLVPF